MARGAIKAFLTSKINLLLIVTVVSLLITFGIVTGVVTVPGFQDQDHDNDNDNSSTSTNNTDRAHYAVIPENFADPCLINDGKGTWYAFATRTNDKVHVQMASAPESDISKWTLHEGHDALPTLGKWVAKIDDPAVWAPYVVNTRNNTYIMYYSALPRNNTQRHCIGAATASHVTGPYIGLDDPIVCDLPKGGVIDPAFFHDVKSNLSYLVYKQDGNAIGVGGACSNTGWPNTPTPLLAVELSGHDLVTPQGDPFELLSNLQSDGPNLESPMLWHYTYDKPASLGGGQISSYHIVYNSGCYNDDSYHIEHIVCTAHPEQSLKDCLWSNIRGDPADPSSMISNGGGIFTGTMLKTGDTVADLFAPGGPSLAGNQGWSGDGDANVTSKYMIFHADVNLAYFEHPATVSQEERLKNGWDRRRGLFVAELDYWGQEDMLKVSSIVVPDNAK